MHTDNFLAQQIDGINVCYVCTGHETVMHSLSFRTCAFRAPNAGESRFGHRSVYLS